MPTTESTLEERERELANRIQMLEQQLDRLSNRVSDEGESAAEQPALRPESRAKPKPVKVYAGEEMPELSEEVLGWATRNSVLPRLAAVCFLLVLALGLRTITDSGLVEKLLGSGIGMCYAAGLMIFAWFKYTKESPLAPVFAACGAVLMSVIVVETHMHFKALPLIPAYFTLMATGFGMALMSRRFNAFVPISVGVLGMCFAGAAIDYPRPFFPYLSLVLLAANVLGYFAAQLKRCSWLRWSVLIVTMLMLQMWGLRLGILLRKGEAVPPELAQGWFLPVLALFFLTFILLSLRGIVSGGSQKISRFDFSLPTLNVIWAYLLAGHILEAWQMNVRLLGLIGLIGGTGLYALAFWCARRGTDGAPGTNTFAFAGSALLAVALPSVTGSYIMSLPIISVVAIVLAIVSRVWENGGLRSTTYLMNTYSAVALVLLLRGDGTGATDSINMLPAALLAFILIYHYQWCRWSPIPATSVLFDTFDRNDRSAVLLLLGGLASGFFMMRVAIFQLLPFVPPALQRDAFRCGQSVLINGAVIALILFAYIRRDKEVRNVAVLVTLVGAIKVFFYDLLGTHGLPLVLSIFSFGTAAAVESIALGKWQKQSVDKAPQEAKDVT
ncbi:MAG: hypothetical protein PHY09_00085 [Desulfuromonadaceae bacterium]|nr:hypothetical protein [Desulfuromonadaceae bacterium]MDD5105953.1 hypothetical protein [Desulfuromonadaceae bacterium]